MPLTAEKTWKVELPSNESLTFRRPTTKERVDIMSEMGKLVGELKEAEAWPQLMAWSAETAKPFLESAEIPYTNGSGETHNVTDEKDWRDIVTADVFYVQYLEGFFQKFFRTTLPTELG